MAPSLASTDENGAATTGTQAKSSVLKSFVRSIDDDVRSAKSFVQAKLEAKRLSLDKRAAEEDLNAAYREIGAKAEQSSLGSDLPAFTVVRTSRKRLTDTEAALAQRMNAARLAQEALQAETDKHANIIAALETEHRRLSDTGAKTKGDLDSLKRQAGRIDDEIARLQTALSAHTGGTPQADPVDTIKQRLASCQRDRAAIEPLLPLSQVAFDEASAAVRSKGAELDAARQDWKQAKSQYQESLQAANAAGAQATRDEGNARTLLNASLQTLGRAAFDVGAGSDQLVAEFRRVQAIRERIGELDRRSAELQMEAAATSGKARRAAFWTAGLASPCICLFIWGWKGLVICACALLVPFGIVSAIKAVRLNGSRKKVRQKRSELSGSTSNSPGDRLTESAEEETVANGRKRCSNCGSGNRNDAQFCESCGTTLEVPPASKNAAQHGGSDGNPRSTIPVAKPTKVPPKTIPGFSKHAFISHSSRDRELAQRVCEVLEGHGLSCWIAPRNINPGLPYDEEIMRGIGASQTFILLLSNAANASMHVKRELMIALRAGHAVYPIRIQEVEPGPKLEYLLEGIHWVDAWTPPLEAHLERLAQLIVNDPNANERQSASGRNRTGGPLWKMRRRRRAAFVAGGLVLALLIAGWAVSTWKEGVISGIVAYLTQQVDARVKGKPSAGPSGQTAEKSKSDQRAALLAQAAQAVSGRQWQAAINAYQAALVLSDDEETRAALARAVNARDQEQAATSERGAFTQLIADAEQYERMGNFLAARNAYEEAAEAALTDAGRAQAREKARKAGESIALQKKKAEYDDFMRQAGGAKARKDWSAAMDWYDKAIAAAPEEASAVRARAAKSELVASRNKKVNLKLLLSCTNDPKMAKKHPSIDQVLDIAGDVVGELSLGIVYTGRASELRFTCPSPRRESVLCTFRSDDPVGQTRVGKEEGVSFSCRLTEIKGESKQDGRIDVITVEVTATR